MKLFKFFILFFHFIILVSITNAENECSKAESKLSNILQKKDVRASQILPLTKKCKSPKIWYNLGVQFMNEGSFTDAGLAFKSAIDLKRELKYELALAKSYYQIDALKKAEAIYKEILERGIANENVHLGLGLIKAKENKPVDAKKNFLKAREMAPYNPYASYNLALIFKAEGDYLQAKKYLNESIRNKSDFSDALIEASKIDVINNDFDNAINKLKLALDSDKNNENIMSFLSKTYLDLMDYEKAIYWSRKSLQIDRDNLEFKLDLARALIANRQSDSALKVLKNHSGGKKCCLVDYLITLARAQIELGFFLPARSNLEKAKVLLQDYKNEESNKKIIDNDLIKVNDLLSEISIIQ